MSRRPCGCPGGRCSAAGSARLCGGNVVEPDDRDFARDRSAKLLERVHRADARRRRWPRRWRRTRTPRRSSSSTAVAAGLLARLGVDLQASDRARCPPPATPGNSRASDRGIPGSPRSAVPMKAIACGGRSEANAWSRRSRPAHCPIRPSRRAGGPRPMPQRTKWVPRSTSCSSSGRTGHIVAIAEQDDPVGLAACPHNRRASPHDSCWKLISRS